MARVTRPAKPAWLTPAEVAREFRVDPKTVTRWAKSGRIPPDAIIRTLGGHRRYKGSFFEEILNGNGQS